MKKPKRLITSAEFSKIMTDACVFLGAVFGIYLINEATNLSTGVKIVDMILLGIAAGLFGADFVILCSELKKRKEAMKHEEDSDTEYDEEEPK